MAKVTGRDYKTRRGGAHAFSGGTGLLCGLAIGLGVAGFVYLKDHHVDAPAAHGKADHKKARGEIPDTEGGEAGADEPPKSYDFYDRLPKAEVVVPEKEKDVHSDAKSVPETRSGTYVLQAGSYRNLADADRVRAQLAAQGVASKVQQATTDSGTWNRIRIGPVSNLDELNRIRQILRKANIDAQVSRVGD
jgi:cell division protein FtsN